VPIIFSALKYAWQRPSAVAHPTQAELFLVSPTA
jgi:hypothetical protein